MNFIIIFLDISKKIQKKENVARKSSEYCDTIKEKNCNIYIYIYIRFCI